MKTSFSIKFYLRDAVQKDGKHKIYVRLIVNREKSELATDFFISPSDWNEQSQTPLKDKKIDLALSKIKADLIRIKERYDYELKSYSAKDISNTYLGRDKSNFFLLSYFQEEIDKRKSLPGEYSEGSTDDYILTKEYVSEFIHSMLSKNDISLKEIDYKFLSDFDYFLITKKSATHNGTIGRNTVNKHHSRLRTIFLKAFKEEMISKNPYSNFELKNTKTSRTFLSQEEIDKIANHSLGGNKSLIKVRDVYMFSVYTALRFGDAMKLQVTDIIKRDNSYYIQKYQSKTEEPIHIKLLKPALEIFLKYDNEERGITGKVLPRISNQKVNTYLATIADLTGIDKKITHHTARHTAATTILLENDVPIEYVSKWLGHNKISTTQIYARITNKALSKIADRIDVTLDNKISGN